MKRFIIVGHGKMHYVNIQQHGFQLHKNGIYIWKIQVHDGLGILYGIISNKHHQCVDRDCNAYKNEPISFGSSYRRHDCNEYQGIEYILRFLGLDCIQILFSWWVLENIRGCNYYSVKSTQEFNEGIYGEWTLY